VHLIERSGAIDTLTCIADGQRAQFPDPTSSDPANGFEIEGVRWVSVDPPRYELDVRRTTAR